MLRLLLPEREIYDETTNKISRIPEFEVILEHSLFSISKWESKWHKSFLGRSGVKNNHTDEQMKDYVRCMCRTEGVPDFFWNYLTAMDYEVINEYIADPATATTINRKEDENRMGGVRLGKIITAEIIYYWMTQYSIPWDCQHWHINKLLTLIQVFQIKNEQAEKEQKKKARASRRRR